MTKITRDLIKNLTDALQDSKCLLLQGSVGVGKTYIAKEIADELRNSAYNFFKVPRKRKQPESEVNCEVIPFHPSLSYEDFVNGISVNTEEGELMFQYTDRILLSAIKMAGDAYYKNENKKYVLILDDIQRSSLTDIMGETINLMEPHRDKGYSITLNSGEVIHITPNFYIIATMGTSENCECLNKSALRRFYTYNLNSDINYIDESDESDLKLTYQKVKRIVDDNLDMQYKSKPLERAKYEIGHGYFQRNTLVYRLKYQVIPLLNQYVREGILSKSAVTNIEQLEGMIEDKYTTNKEYADLGRITNYKTGVTPEIFLNDLSKPASPLINLVGRIKEQGIISDKDIENYILFNSHIAYRKAEEDGINFYATLVAGKVELGRIRRLTGDRRPFYDGSSYITVKGENYYYTKGIHAADFTKNLEKRNFDDDNEIGESTPPAGILFFMIESYYRAVICNLKNYINEYDSDENINLLMEFAQNEWECFKEQYALITPDKTPFSNEKDPMRDAYLKANTDVRELISNLKLLWNNVDDVIENDKEDKIKVKGVYRTMNEKTFKEYIEAMDSLGVNQMILQGPPGTSKTYTARELLKFVEKGLENDEVCTNEELESMQITDYANDEYCKYIKETNEHPSIAWDIVQFHPSYGYEDFIRGIEVSTKESDDESLPKRKYISYDTVNKTLGKIAELAKKVKKLREEGAIEKETKFFLIIDEINRANLATVFGELIYALEYRGEGVATPYTVDSSNKIELPDNLYIIGTMNTADKSIGGIDYAIRRRFLFFSQLPDKEIIKNFRADNGSDQMEINEKSVRLFNEISRLFDNEILSSEYYKEDVQIGHTYFLVNSEDQLFKRFIYQIIPILREYYKDGIFRFEIPEDNEGFNGLLKCICGDINTSDVEVIKKIYDELISK